MNEQTFLPITINITNKKLLIIGGGKVAAHKLSILNGFSNNITVLAPQICEEIESTHINTIKKKYEEDELDGYFLIYACTNNTELNAKIKEDANERGILVNIADDSLKCDFISPAIYRSNNITVAVGSNGQDVKMAISIRNKIKDFLNNNL